MKRLVKTFLSSALVLSLITVPVLATESTIQNDNFVNEATQAQDKEVNEVNELNEVNEVNKVNEVNDAEINEINEINEQTDEEIESDEESDEYALSELEPKAYLGYITVYKVNTHSAYASTTTYNGNADVIESHVSITYIDSNSVSHTKTGTSNTQRNVSTVKSPTLDVGSTAQSAVATGYGYITNGTNTQTQQPISKALY